MDQNNQLILEALLSPKGKEFTDTLQALTLATPNFKYSMEGRLSDNIQDKRHLLPPIELPYLNRNINNPLNYFRSPQWQSQR